MKNQSGITIIICLLLILTSCSISLEKRRYRPGYHVEVIKNHPQTVNKPIDIPEVNVAQTPNENFASSKSVSGDGQPAETRSENEKPISSPQKEIKKRENKKRGMDSCDVIFTAMGERIQAKVIEIAEDYVNYKLCDDPKGRLYTLKTKMIDNITLRNGDIYVPPNRVIVDKDQLRKKSQSLFTASIVSASVGLIGFVFSFFIAPFSYLAVAFLIMSGITSFILALMDKKPGMYAPSYRTKAVWILYLVVLLMVIAGLILAFI